MSSESWNRLQSDGTMNFDSGMACLSALDVRRIGIIVALLVDASAAAAVEVLA